MVCQVVPKKHVQLFLDTKVQGQMFTCVLEEEWLQHIEQISSPASVANERLSWHVLPLPPSRFMFLHSAVCSEGAQMFKWGNSLALYLRTFAPLEKSEDSTPKVCRLNVRLPENEFSSRKQCSKRRIIIIADHDNKYDSSSVLFFNFFLSFFVPVVLLLSPLNTVIDCKTTKTCRCSSLERRGFIFGSNRRSLFSHKWAWEFEFDGRWECQQVFFFVVFFPQSAGCCRHMST